mmetsp:Transcript_12198/g.23335  ORF Transcript_12198/g.23335 Transcript_12198/m.23335 type:complete len:564 (-) Transcript_12198:27-1718(-)
MRVLLPLFQNNGKGDASGETREENGHDTAGLTRVTEPTEQNSNQSLLETKAPVKQEDDRKLKAFVFNTSSTATAPSTILGDHRKRPFQTETCTASPKRSRFVSTAFAKKPPPSQLKSIETKMTAPRFFEAEQEEQHQREEEVLENEPPVAMVAAAPRNFAIRPVQDDGENDPALASTVTSAATTAEGVPHFLHDHTYAQALKKRGLEIVEQAGDGNCLFRAVSLQVYGDPSMHSEVRTRCMDFMAVNEEHFSEFVTGEAYADYIARKRLDGVHGNNPEIQAISELYNRPVEVYTPERGASPLNIFHEEYGTADIPIRLSYHDGNHYNAVIDPIRPTAGLGLGLPGLQPGLADKQQVATAVMESDQEMDLEKAIKESEQELSQAYDDELQRALKESTESVAYMYKQKALAFSDLDATSLEMEQTALESSLQSYIQTEMSRKKRASPEDQSSRAQQQQRNSSPVLPAYAAAPAAAAAAASTPSPPLHPPTVGAAAAGSSPPAASSASVAGYNNHGEDSNPDEYPAVVQELVMNGFELSKVVRAYELIGDNFDNLLSFLCSNGDLM